MNLILANTPDSQKVLREKEWQVEGAYRSGFEITLISSSGELQGLGSRTKCIL